MYAKGRNGIAIKLMLQLIRYLTNPLTGILNIGAARASLNKHGHH